MYRAKNEFRISKIVEKEPCCKNQIRLETALLAWPLFRGTGVRLTHFRFDQEVRKKNWIRHAQRQLENENVRCCLAVSWLRLTCAKMRSREFLLPRSLLAIDALSAARGKLHACAKIYTKEAEGIARRWSLVLPAGRNRLLGLLRSSAVKRIPSEEPVSCRSCRLP